MIELRTEGCAEDVEQDCRRMTELKTCPCCGGEALYVHTSHVGRHSIGRIVLDVGGVAVECKKCGLITRSCMSKVEVRDLWNRRVTE